MRPKSGVPWRGLARPLWRKMKVTGDSQNPCTCSGWGRGTGTGRAGVIGGYHVEKESVEYSGVRFCYERDRRSELERLELG